MRTNSPSCIRTSSAHAETRQPCSFVTSLACTPSARSATSVHSASGGGLSCFPLRGFPTKSTYVSSKTSKSGTTPPDPTGFAKPSQRSLEAIRFGGPACPTSRRRPRGSAQSLRQFNSTQITLFTTRVMTTLRTSRTIVHFVTPGFYLISFAPAAPDYSVRDVPSKFK